MFLASRDVTLTS